MGASKDLGQQLCLLGCRLSLVWALATLGGVRGGSCLGDWEPWAVSGQAPESSDTWSSPNVCCISYTHRSNAPNFAD